MELKDSTKELLVFLSVTLILILGFAYYLFEITGIRIVLGIIFVSLPFYLIILNLDVTEGEKFVFSLLLGLTLFSSFVYLLGLVISFRLSIIIVFAVLVIAAFVLKRYKPKKHLQH